MQEEKETIKLGIRIRANPSNSSVLEKLGVLVVVPPDLEGQKAQTVTKGKGGQWDDMKRTLSWSINMLQPGESMDIQVVFPKQGGASSNLMGERRFPILLQCHGEKDLFSKLEAWASGLDAPSRSLKLHTKQQTTVLFRKA